MSNKSPSFYLIGNSTCSNRGDGAILRGLLNGLRDKCPKARIRIVSRFPNSASWFLGEEVNKDLVYDLHRFSGSLLGKISFQVKKAFYMEYLYFLLKYSILKYFLPIPGRYTHFINDIEDYDNILQVGGSFFVDYYGLIQFEALIVALLANKKVTLVGHSLGPFRDKKTRRFAKLVFSRVNIIYLRESESYAILRDLNIPEQKIRYGSDTAWLVQESKKSNVANIELGGIKKPKIALTLRTLRPFDDRLGITQFEYERRIISLINYLIQKGYHVVILSMCTGLDSYAYDDRMVGLRVRNKVRQPKEVTVLMHEYSDLELGSIMRDCELLIGTRLHSVILSLRYGTPAFAIYYEHKSLGILKFLGLEKFSLTIQEVGGEAMLANLGDTLNDLDEIKLVINQAVANQVEKGNQMISELCKENG